MLLSLLILPVLVLWHSKIFGYSIQRSENTAALEERRVCVKEKQHSVLVSISNFKLQLFLQCQPGEVFIAKMSSVWLWHKFVSASALTLVICLTRVCPSVRKGVASRVQAECWASWKGEHKCAAAAKLTQNTLIAKNLQLDLKAKVFQLRNDDALDTNKVKKRGVVNIIFSKH